MFKNSLAETLTETEKAFNLGFISMTEAIITMIRLVSLAVIAIIMVVAANTMAMTARERMSEYATFKALGFDGFRIGVLVWGESLTLTAAGGALGMALTFPAARYFESQLGQFFPVFHVSNGTLLMDVAAIVVVGVAASIVPTWRAARRRRRRLPAPGCTAKTHLGAASVARPLGLARTPPDRRAPCLGPVSCCRCEVRMAIPYSYSLRNLWTRRLTTVLTAAGMAMVVFVFAAMQMLAAGLRATLVETGSYDNAVLIRKSSQTEVQSSVAREPRRSSRSSPRSPSAPGASGSPPRRSSC